MRKTVLVRRYLLAATILALFAAPASAAGTLFYGTRAGMVVTVVSRSGLSTANAVIKIEHTRENARQFCREYVGKVTEKCIRDEMAIPLKTEIRANCQTGEFTNFYGYTLFYKGPNRRKDAATKYIVADDKGEIADGSGASSYDVHMDIFRALCPRQAPRAN